MKAKGKTPNTVKAVDVCPDHLSAESQAIWKRLVDDWDFYRAREGTEAAPPDLAMFIPLRIALEAFDRLQEARGRIAKEGAYYRTKTGFLKEHPALRIEKEARSGFLMSWRMLNLGVEEPGEIGRPSGEFGG